MQNQPRVPPKDAYAESFERSWRQAGQPFSLCIPVLSEKEPNLSDLGVGICLYFETLRAYGLLFLLLFMVNAPCIIMTFLVNPSAHTDALENGGLFDVFLIGTVAALLKGIYILIYRCVCLRACVCVFLSVFCVCVCVCVRVCVCVCVCVLAIHVEPSLPLLACSAHVSTRGSQCPPVATAVLTVI